MRTVSIALDIDPSKRFTSAGQLAEALAECLGAPVPAEVASSRKPSSKIKARVATVALALLVALGFAGWRARGPRPAGETAHVPANQYDQYLKAQNFLQHSYTEANLTSAVNEFQQILKADPNFALAQAGLGQAYFLEYRNQRDEKLLDLANQATAKALQLDANLAPPYITVARIAALQGHTSLAMQQLQK